MFLASSDAIGLLFGCLFVYAVAGVMLFGGLIFDGNDALDETDYRDSGYDGGLECRALNRSVHDHRLFSWLTTHHSHAKAMIMLTSPFPPPQCSTSTTTGWPWSRSSPI